MFARWDFASMKGVVSWFAGVSMLCILAADFLAEKLGISPGVMERSELRKQRYYAQPISTEIVNEQQAGADIFFRLGLMPKAIRVADIVYASHTSTP
jgi:hypothetical protein